MRINNLFITIFMRFIFALLPLVTTSCAHNSQLLEAGPPLPEDIRWLDSKTRHEIYQKLSGVSPEMVALGMHGGGGVLPMEFNDKICVDVMNEFLNRLESEEFIFLFRFNGQVIWIQAGRNFDEQSQPVEVRDFLIWQRNESPVIDESIFKGKAPVRVCRRGEREFGVVFF